MIPLKSFSIFTLFLFVVISGLLANTVRLHWELDKSRQINRRQSKWLELSKIQLLQVQLMDRILEKQEGKQLDVLLGDSNKWLAPLKEMINADAKLSSLLKSVSIRSLDLNNPNEYTIYCNPVNNSPEPHEVFTMTFDGDKCTAIRRQALCLW